MIRKIFADFVSLRLLRNVRTTTNSDLQTTRTDVLNSENNVSKNIYKNRNNQSFRLFIWFLFRRFPININYIVIKITLFVKSARVTS